MILYTTTPHELIFPCDQTAFENYKTISYQGVPIVVEQTENHYRIVQVLSSNPNDFMKDELAPGQLISFI
ncbi:YlzJ-like family protein [Heyndrickxia sporothermodurans]|uniref:YlzJ-like family protein n=1 Tax=Heyndrickxia sporothermodurans TaxID=46224 RepID=A0A150KNS7_9BACI|nr:YlzJ-like family protein [Heyndrickxia sporothermodurans]KYD00067.1 hypothetical protein B4102_1079 [Heyndrickxia sporothermodurans]MBL5767733.1 YlzJ-like family protein [Heyndrickxia sporothermodurans]MBL5771239.1 YlzJ-like family protein [Heyndrickxia sporothermodurans]MBL5774930.1 YlzJ-like family protein [Heyndrickxia sporothermodurans]MBL5778405.1 YlzJ-like family protein [Heyndrickxia sporothermodurans]